MRADIMKRYKVKYVKALESLVNPVESLMHECEKEVHFEKAVSNCPICQQIKKIRAIICKVN